MVDLSVVSDDVLRAMLERDADELNRCLEHKLCKSAILLAGSIIETVLVDFYLAFPRQDSTHANVLRADLSVLIEWAAEDGVLSARTKELSAAIRNYRNLIHPGREKRSGEHIDFPTATVAANLVDIIVRDIAASYAARRGLTCEQVLNKVSVDPSCRALFPHLIDGMSASERVKLFEAIPSYCATRTVQGALADSLIELHRLLKQKVPEDVWIAGIRQVYHQVRSGAKMDVLFHLRFFSRDLTKLPNEERDVILSYVLNALALGSSHELQSLESWGYLDSFWAEKYFGDAESLRQLVEETIGKRLYTRLMSHKRPTEYPSREGDVPFMAIMKTMLGFWKHEFAEAVLKAVEGEEDIDPDTAHDWGQQLRDTYRDWGTL